MPLKASDSVKKAIFAGEKYYNGKLGSIDLPPPKKYSNLLNWYSKEKHYEKINHPYSISNFYCN